uniref:prephenate dehydratase n=1 Tax=Fervidicoccus fontis TaxID=683846 RepID=A0A7J3ZLM5_9CREN
MLRVAFLGPKGSFSEEAAVKAFCAKEVEFYPKSSIDEVFWTVESNETDYGIVPVENSIEGGVHETLDLLAKTTLRVQCEIQVKIGLHLVAHSETSLSNIKLIVSHPHALAQARRFLSRLKGVRVEFCSSTAEAARRASASREIAALASKLAATVYGLKVLVENVQDYEQNITRFFVLGRTSVPTGALRLKVSGYRTSIVMLLPHRPGALYRALEPFARREINLTRIESRPVQSKPWEYLFHLDFEGSIEDENCREAVEELERRALAVKVLGSYPVLLALE